MGELRTGGSAIDTAAESKGGGEFKPFLSNLYWDEDKQDKYLLFLTPIEEIEDLGVMGSPQLDIIKIFEPKPDMIVAKTDPVIGERRDRFVDSWDAIPRTTNLAIAVELEPIEETVKGRLKPVGFKIATREYQRRIVEDGELTDEVEDVIQPEIGLVAQAPSNFFSILKHKNDTEYSIHETAQKVTRHGEKTNTTYEFNGYEDQPIDLSDLIDHIDGLSYIKDSLDELKLRIDGLDPEQAALIIGDHILRQRVDDMLDSDNYDELFEGITTSMDKFGSKRKGKDKKTTRPSQRKEKVTASPDEENTQDKLKKLRARAAATKEE